MLTPSQLTDFYGYVEYAMFGAGLAAFLGVVAGRLLCGLLLAIWRRNE